MLSFGCFVEDSLFIQDTRFIHLSHFLCIYWPYMTSEMTLILQSNQNETKYERNRYISNRERYRHNVLYRIQCIVKVHIIKLVLDRYIFDKKKKFESPVKLKSASMFPEIKSILCKHYQTIRTSLLY